MNELSSTRLLEFAVIRGAPGAGKSTVAEALRVLFAAGCVIEIDSMKGMLNRPDWRSQEQTLHAVTAGLAAIKQYGALGYAPCTIVGALSDADIEQLRTVAARENMHPRIVTLWADNDVLAQRLMRRGPDQWKDLDASIVMNRELAATPLERQLLLNTGTLPLHRTCESIATFLGYNSFAAIEAGSTGHSRGDREVVH